MCYLNLSLLFSYSLQNSIISEAVPTCPSLLCVSVLDGTPTHLLRTEQHRVEEGGVSGTPGSWLDSWVGRGSGLAEDSPAEEGQAVEGSGEGPPQCHLLGQQGSGPPVSRGRVLAGPSLVGGQA